MSTTILLEPGPDRVAYTLPNVRYRALLDIHTERVRQEQAHPHDSVAQTHVPHRAPTPLSHLMAALGDVARSQNDGEYDGPGPDPMSILIEEVGEVAQCLNDQSGNLEAELTQVAAVAVAWIEAIRKERSS